jgi:hypothetical protein
MVTKAIVFERNGSRYTYTIQNSKPTKRWKTNFLLSTNLNMLA